MELRAPNYGNNFRDADVHLIYDSCGPLGKISTAVEIYKRTLQQTQRTNTNSQTQTKSWCRVKMKLSSKTLLGNILI